MAVTTLAFCRQCKWRSSVTPGRVQAAGAACPTCSTGISTLHYDPTYTGTDPLGRPYSETAVAAAYLAEAGISTVAPATAVAIPPHGAIASPPALPISVS
jgi:hypothetical protein